MTDHALTGPIDTVPFKVIGLTTVPGSVRIPPSASTPSSIRIPPIVIVISVTVVPQNSVGWFNIPPSFASSLSRSVQSLDIPAMQSDILILPY